MAEKVYGICENKCRMEVIPKSTLLTATIKTAWTGSSAPYSQKITAAGIEADDVIEISLPKGVSAEQVEAFNALMLQDGGQTDGSFTLHAFGEINVVAIPINIIVRREL